MAIENDPDSRMPNDVTIEALEAAERGEGTMYKDVDELFDDLGKCAIDNINIFIEKLNKKEISEPLTAEEVHLRFCLIVRREELLGNVFIGCPVGDPGPDISKDGIIVPGVGKVFFDKEYGILISDCYYCPVGEPGTPGEDGVNVPEELKVEIEEMLE